MSQLSDLIAMEIRKVSNPVLMALIGTNDPDVSALAAKEGARRIIAERPRG